VIDDCGEAGAVREGVVGVPVPSKETAQTVCGLGGSSSTQSRCACERTRGSIRATPQPRLALAQPAAHRALARCRVP
jgi:hypothetical protein